MKKILLFLKTTMAVPQPLGPFHLIAVFLMILITFCVCFFFGNADEKTFRVILVVIWAIMFTMEGIKQLEESYTISADGDFLWRYNWGTFPLQLCDSPLYLLLPIAFMKDGKLREALSAFMYTYILLGGISTFILISTTFGTNVYCNVQTLAHHGLQVVSCTFIAVHNRRRISREAFGGALSVFLCAVGIATLFNVVVHYFVPDQVVNMFFISPFFKKTMPILNDAWSKLHWLPTIALYVVGVSVLAFAVFSLFRQIFSKEDVKESVQKVCAGN